MLIAAVAAFAAGLIAGLVFRPLAIIPIAIIFLVVLFTFGVHRGMPGIVAGLIIVWVMNVGYLSGALLSYYVLGAIFRRPRERSTWLARWFMR
jgi:hypothetical protein